MKEVHDMAKNSEKYAYLNRLSTEQLEELLRMDAEEARPGNEDVVFISWR